MRSLRFVALATVFALVVETARADAPTPFLEGKRKVGDVETAPARVLKAADGVYAVVVASDTGEHYVLPATAKDGVVKAEHLNKEMTIKARVVSWTERKDRHPAVELEILSVAAP